MKLIFILLVVAGITVVVFLAARKRGGIQADVNAAVAKGEYQFIALMDDAIVYPQVPEVPDWYFRTTGIRIRHVKPETRETDYAYMTNYNAALYQALKAQDKFHIIEENIARVKTNLDEQPK